MAYRASETSSLSPPPPNDIWWTVYQKSNHSNRTRILTKYWINARINGAIQLGLAPEECEAKRHENL